MSRLHSILSNRRRLLGAGATYLLKRLCGDRAFAQSHKEKESPKRFSPSPTEFASTLLSARIELAGSWGSMRSGSVELVLERMRHACLDGIRLISDRQPTRLRVDGHTAG